MDVAAKLREQYAGHRVSEAVMLSTKTMLDRVVQRLSQLRDRYTTSLGQSGAAAEALRQVGKGLEVDLDDKTLPDFDKAFNQGLSIAKQQVMAAIGPVADFVKAAAISTSKEDRPPGPEAPTPAATPRGVTTRNPGHRLTPAVLERKVVPEEGEAGPPAVSTADPKANGAPTGATSAKAAPPASPDPQEPAGPAPTPTESPPGKA